MGSCVFLLSLFLTSKFVLLVAEKLKCMIAFLTFKIESHYRVCMEPLKSCRDLHNLHKINYSLFQKYEVSTFQQNFCQLCVDISFLGNFGATSKALFTFWQMFMADWLTEVLICWRVKTCRSLPQIIKWKKRLQYMLWMVVNLWPIKKKLNWHETCGRD